MNLFGTERIAEVSLSWGRSHLVGARWQGIRLLDTMRHIPASVAELGKLVGIPKLKKDFRSAAYCIRDAAITFRTAKTLHEIYHSIGERPRMTLASTALRLWQERYFGKPVYRPLPEVWEAGRLAYYGGRTEPFRIGEHGPLTVIDVASMFPWAMTAGAFPIPWGSFSRAKPGQEAKPTGIYYALIESDLPIPALPYRTPAGLVYPNGKFRGWYIGEELIYLARIGGAFRILRGFDFFDEVKPFDGYVADLFAKKSEARGPLRTIYKLLLNSLYGKFGQKGETVRSMPLEKFRDLKVAPIDFRVWNGLAIYRKDGDPPPWGNNVWAAIVTARARIRLHEEMVRIFNRGGGLLYCDTDSVMFTGPGGRYPERATKAGKFEIRGRYKEILIVGKKEYALGDFEGRREIHAKGIPLAHREEYLETGTATFSRPFRIIESSRGGGKANVWREVSKTRRVSFDSRSRRADGSLVPVSIIED